MNKLFSLSALALIALSIGLSSCAKKNESIETTSAPITEDPQINQTQAAMNKATVTCKDDNHCHSGVGLLLSANGDTVGMCTAFLISNDLAVTSADCLPRSIRKEGASCSKEVKLIFPDNGAYPKASAQCSRVVSLSLQDRTRDAQALNYAIIKLDQELFRERLELVDTGVNDGTLLQNYKMEPLDGDEPSAELTYQECRSVQNSLAFPQYNNSTYPVVSFSDCKMGYGNSGSPLLDGKGHVLAMAHAERLGSLNEAASRLLSNGIAPVAIHFASNFSCIPNPLSPHVQIFADDCHAIVTASDLETARDHLLSETEKNAVEIFNKQINSEVEPSVKAFRWKAVTLSGSDVFQIPVCYNNPSKDSWVKEYDLSFGLGLWYPKKRTREYTLPVWKLNVMLDKYQVPQIVGQRTTSIRTTIDFSPRKVHNDKTTPLKETIYQKADVANVILEADIQKCAN